MNNNEVLSDAFKWMFIGLLISGITAYFTSYVFDNLSAGLILISAVLEIVVALIFNIRIKKLSPTSALSLYLIYAVLTGFSLNSIFLLYTESSITLVFLITACVFAIFALIGKNTNINLAKYGIYLFVALIGCLILTIVNIFIQSASLNLMICYISIIVFCLYIAYDVNMLLNSHYLDDTNNKGIYFAFQLFVDFINLFIRLLELFGKRKD